MPTSSESLFGPSLFIESEDQTKQMEAERCREREEGNRYSKHSSLAIAHQEEDALRTSTKTRLLPLFCLSLPAKAKQERHGECRAHHVEDAVGGF